MTDVDRACRGRRWIRSLAPHSRTARLNVVHLDKTCPARRRHRYARVGPPYVSMNLLPGYLPLMNDNAFAAISLLVIG